MGVYDCTSSSSLCVCRLLSLRSSRPYTPSHTLASYWTRQRLRRRLPFKHEWSGWSRCEVLPTRQDPGAGLTNILRGIALSA